MSAELPPGLPGPKEIIPLVEQILQDHQEGISEYEFLLQLAKHEPFFAGDKTSADNLALFQRHFLLFHCLYQLEKTYRANDRGKLIISALEIRLSGKAKHGKKNTQTGMNELTTPDTVRDYYLDISNLSDTDVDEVDELLGKFWLALARHEARDDALRLLGLQDPVDDVAIRKKYRELVMQHHPDRGGKVETIQQLNDAISKLLPKA
jgi:hypothetical protein